MISMFLAVRRKSAGDTPVGVHALVSLQGLDVKNVYLQPQAIRITSGLKLG